jgi:hypothetical protein
MRKHLPRHTSRGMGHETCDETLDLKFFRPTQLPSDLMPMHRIRIEDAVANRSSAFIR